MLTGSVDQTAPAVVIVVMGMARSTSGAPRRHVFDASFAVYIFVRDHLYVGPDKQMYSTSDPFAQQYGVVARISTSFAVYGSAGWVHRIAHQHAPLCLYTSVPACM